MGRKISFITVVFMLYNIVTIWSIGLISFFYIAIAGDTYDGKLITIWGYAIVQFLNDPELSFHTDYEFGPGYYGAIKPLFITTIVLFVVMNFFHSNPIKHHWFFTGKNFLFYRVGRFLFGMSGVFGLISLIQFSKFITELNELEIYVFKLNPLYYFGVVTFSLTILVGFFNATREINVIPQKTNKHYTEIEPLDDENGSVKQQKELDLPEIDSSKMSRQEIIERIKAIVEGKKESDLTWVETVTLIPREEITEIVTNELELVVLDGKIMSHELAKKRENKKKE